MVRALGWCVAIVAVTLAACSGASVVTGPPPADVALVVDASVAPLDVASDAPCGPCARVCVDAEVCVADACVPAANAPPRLVAPASLGRLTSRRPTLRWLLPAGSTEATVQVCEDRACTRVVQSADTTLRAWLPPAALARGVYFWRVLARRGASSGAASATWEFQVRARGADVDSRLGSMTDLDGDGYADLVLSTQGAPHRMAVHAGGPDGPSLTATFEFPRGADGSSVRVATVGDLNGDGFSDWLSFEGTGDVQRVLLHPGGPRGVPVAPVTLALAEPWPDVLFGAGDVDGDGYSDLLGVDRGTTGPRNEVRVLFGAHGGLRPHSAVLLASDPAVTTGMVANGSADANGDGLPDFIFGFPSENDGAGRAMMWLSSGCGGGRLVALPGDTGELAHFGDDVALAGDYNGDGYADALVAAPHDRDAIDRSAVWIFPGSANGPVTDNPARVSFAGRQTERIGLLGGADVDGDGYSDLAAWMHLGDRETEAKLMMGSATGLPATPVRTLVGSDFTTDTRGFGVGFASDANRDGFDDLVIYLAPGNVMISLGSPTGPTPGPRPLFTLP